MDAARVDPTDGDGSYYVTMHNYEEEGDKCRVCGRPAIDIRHPHIFIRSAVHVGCVCGKSSRALVHQMTSI